MTWGKEGYEASVTSRCWSATPFDAGWDESAKYGEDLPASAELRAIFEEEAALGELPEWALEVIERMIGSMSTCGHYSFPRPLLQLVDAIGREECVEFVIAHYTADGGRKRLMSYYVYCLDAWLNDAPREVAAAELALRDSLGKDWPAILGDIYDALGERTAARELLVRRLIHRLRWWIKTLVWFDDKRDCWQLDVYGGDARGALRTRMAGDPRYVSA